MLKGFFGDYQNLHENESILVLGLGESINLLPATSVLSIGVNDIGRKHTPTYLLSVNRPGQYARTDRWQFIINSRAAAIFTQSPGDHANAKIPIVEIEVGTEAGVEVVGNQVPHYRNSPYMAVTIAAYMGAKRIGLLGVDFTDNHFWQKDGPHRLNRELEKINTAYGKLAEHLKSRGTYLRNLSPYSRLASIPKAEIMEWLMC